MNVFVKTNFKLLLMFLLGLGAGWFLTNQFQPKPLAAKIDPIRSPIKGFAYIDPLIGFDVAQQYFPEFQSLKSSLENFVSSQEGYGKDLSVSLYLRNVENGHWFGINEDDNFNPGSLMKIPIMITYLKEAETNPEIFNKKIFYSSADANDQSEVENPLKSKLIKNKDYSVQELIANMIINSDNEAMNLLVNNVDKNYLSEVFFDFGIQLPKDSQYSMSPKVFSRFLRRLYNATYLNREFSEKALQLLTETTYVKGIVAGIPSPISIAHKYGERGIYQGNKLVGVELHECGIIYYPGKPLLLCIMTKGNNREVLESILSGIAKIINDFSVKI